MCIRDSNPSIQFSSDFIIGYPGEEDEDFKATFKKKKKIKFINSYSFIFSPRPGTVAADLNLIDKKISMERLEKIQSQLYDNQMHMNKSLEHKTIKVLDLMNRKHTISDYYKIFDQLKEINPSIQFSSDFIIGYPGEEDEDFKATFELIKKIKFINSYSFIFSPRPGTVAANLNLIDKKISMERLEKIQSQLYDNRMPVSYTHLTLPTKA